MKKTLLLLTFVSGLLTAKAQDCFVGPITSPDTIQVNQAATISFNFGNVGTAGLPAGEWPLNVLFPPTLTVNQDSLNLGPFQSILGNATWNVSSSGTALSLQTIQTLPPGMTGAISVRVTGADTGQAQLVLFTGGPAVPGDANPNNDGASRDITVIPAVPLPVTLISFKGSLADHRTARLSWLTANAVQFARFELERGTGGIFEKVATIPYNGQHQYELNDPVDGLAGSIFYRLRMIDQDGSSRLSPVVLVHAASVQEDLSLYPNPAASHLKVKGINAAAAYTIRTADGRSVQTGTLDKGASIDVSTLPAGIYLVQIVTGDQVRMLKMTKQ